jgi:hypothetical protein
MEVANIQIGDDERLPYQDRAPARQVLKKVPAAEAPV